MVDVAAVLDAMDANQTGRIPGLLRGATEAERRPLFAAAQVRAESRFRVEWFWGSLDAAEVVMLGSGTLTELRRQVDFMHCLGGPAAFEVLTDRSPSWMERLVPALLRANRASGAWLLVRSLVREGIVERPSDPGYLAAMVEGLTDRDVQCEDRVERRAAPVPVSEREHLIHERLLADPTLIDREVLELFRSEAAAVELDHKWGPGPSWSGAIVRLIDDGRLSRDVVLDGCLGGFLADIRPNRLRWHAELWSSLAPTVDELEARTGTLIAVGGAPPAPGVDVALASYATLQRAGRLPSHLVAEAVRGPLLRIEKARAMRALRLVRAADLQPEHAVRSVLPALDHPRSDVQDAALGILGDVVGHDPTWADELDPALRVDLARALRSVSPVLANQAAALLAAVDDPALTSDAGGTMASGPTVTVGLADVPADARVRLGLDEALHDMAHGRIPPPLSAQAVAAWGPPMPPPVRDMTELTELLAMLLEDARDPVEVERAIDGIARFADQQPPKSLLASRSDLFVGGGFRGVDLRLALFQVVRAWEAGSAADLADARFWQVDDGLAHRPPVWSWVGLRLDFIRAVAGVRAAGVLTAVPTHRLGWIEASALVERLREAANVGFCGGILALIRLGPVADAEAAELIAALEQQSHPFAAVLSFALGGPEVRSKDPRFEPWARAARWARGARVEAELEGRTVPTRWFRRNLDTSLFWPRWVEPPLEAFDLAALLPASADTRTVRSVHLSYRSGGADGLLQLLPSLSPATPDCVANALAPALGLAIGSADWSAAPALDGLRPRELPLGPAAHFAIVLAAGAAESGGRTAAADLLIDAALDGRLDPAHLGGALGDLLRDDVVKAGRVAPVLADAAATSPLVAARLSDAIEAALPALVDPGQRNVHLFLEVLANGRSLLGRSVSDVAAREALEQLAARAGRTRAAVEARRILALEESASAPSSRTLAAREAIEGRIARIGDRPLGPVVG